MNWSHESVYEMLVEKGHTIKPEPKNRIRKNEYVCVTKDQELGKTYLILNKGDSDYKTPIHIKMELIPQGLFEKIREHIELSSKKPDAGGWSRYKIKKGKTWHDFARAIGLECASEKQSAMMAETIDGTEINKRQSRELVQKLEDEEADYQKPGKQRSFTQKKSWIRDPEKRDAAISRAGFRCEMDSSHSTFVIDGEQFMEGHHLVPMECQSKFAKTLDFVDNIVSLCPNCHRKIHLGDSQERIEMAALLARNRPALFARLAIEPKQIEEFYRE